MTTFSYHSNTIHNKKNIGSIDCGRCWCCCRCITFIVCYHKWNRPKKIANDKIVCKPTIEHSGRKTHGLPLNIASGKCTVVKNCRFISIALSDICFSYWMLRAMHSTYISKCKYRCQCKWRWCWCTMFMGSQSWNNDRRSIISVSISFCFGFVHLFIYLVVFTININKIIGSELRHEFSSSNVCFCPQCTISRWFWHLMPLRLLMFEKLRLSSFVLCKGAGSDVIYVRSVNFQLVSISIRSRSEHQRLCQFRSVNERTHVSHHCCNPLSLHFAWTIHTLTITSKQRVFRHSKIVVFHVSFGCTAMIDID